MSWAAPGGTVKLAHVDARASHVEVTEASVNRPDADARDL
jgi:hypothetical protein